ncbi:MAG: hypothetical protein AB7E80_05395 [Hyphomicrobiaceae bacterium]
MAEHGHDLEFAGFPLAKFLDHAIGSGNAVYGVIRDNLKELVSLGIGALGLYKWWIHREVILHAELEKYIARSDANLAPATDAAIHSILRSGGQPALAPPTYARELRHLVAPGFFRRNLALRTTQRAVEASLAKSLKGLKNRINTTKRANEPLQRQRASIHLLSGCIDFRKSEGDARLNMKALREFRAVLATPGFTRDVRAKEMEAVQLLRLGDDELALAAFEQLHEFAGDLVDQRNRDLIQARSKRFRGLIHQSGSPRSLTAWNLLSPAQGALAQRAPHAPFEDWEALEQGDTLYAAAFVASLFNWPREKELLSEALSCYQLAAASNIRDRKERKALHSTALFGIARCNKSLAEKDYDLDFLFQPKPDANAALTPQPNIASLDGDGSAQPSAGVQSGANPAVSKQNG